MAGFSSREYTIDWDSTTLVGVQSKDATVNWAPIDVTTDDDNGYRTLLTTPGVKSADINVSGITSDEVLLAAINGAGAAGETLTLNLPSDETTPGNLEGTFIITSFTMTGSSSDGAVEFSAAFQSTGAFSYTASA